MGIVKKIFAVVLISILSTLIAAIYGALNDQITYSISPEYYTKFKFQQFNIASQENVGKLKNLRLFVAFVGVLATWWVGLFFGFILGAVALIYNNWKTMIQVSIKSILIAIATTFTSGILGLVYGKIYLANQHISIFESWYIHKNLVDFKNFISVGSMHNFSYVGGVFGLIFGIIYLIRRKRNYQPSIIENQP